MDRLNYHHLHYFWLVARLGSFTKAAAELRIAQSAVSSQVAQLESHLGATLIKRQKSRAIELTEAGRLAFDRAEEIFRQGRELTESVKLSSDFRTVKIGAIGSLSKNLQVRLLERVFKNKNVQVEIEIGDADTLLKRLQSYQIDALICDFPYPGSEDEPLVQIAFAEEEVCLIGKKLDSPLGLAKRLAEDGVFLPAKSRPTCMAAENFLKTEYPGALIRGYIDDIALLRLLAFDTRAVVVTPRIGVQRELKSKTFQVLAVLPHQKEKFYFVARRRGSRTKKLLELFGL